VENYLGEFHRKEDVFSPFRASKYTKESLGSLEQAAVVGQTGGTGK
jgi:hypothetical protein